MNVVILHHWLVAYRGGEKVLEELIKLYPDAEIRTLVYEKGATSELVESRPIKDSPLGRFPHAVRKRYKSLLPLHPYFIKRISIPKNTDIVISTDAGMIKGVPIPEGIKHICYCHSPPRYLWGLQEQYETGSGAGLKKKVLDFFGPRLRKFDRDAARKVDRFIANSGFIANRIKDSYDCDAEVIYPPVATGEFEGEGQDKGFYLLVSQLTPYKKAELTVKAFNRMARPLVVIGGGELLEEIREMAGPTVDVRGRVPWHEVKEAFMNCRAFLYPQIEDFGITAVEAQAAGKPVIAYAQGGALETVIENKTGIFFKDQTADSMIEAVERFESGAHQISAENCRNNALRFGEARFRQEIAGLVERAR